MIKTFRSKPLAKFAATGETRKLPVQGAAVAKLARQLAFLNAAAKPDDMNIPGWFYHPLQGTPARFSVRVTANYRLTYAWEEPDAVDVDLEDYH
jgi:proteic killer suppression protein